MNVACYTSDDGPYTITEKFRLFSRIERKYGQFRRIK